MTNYFLVGDVGGTKTTLAIVSENHKFVKEGYFLNANFFSFEEMLFAFLEGKKIRGAVFGVAGKVDFGISKMTNLNWTLSEDEIRKNLKVERVHLINDLEATGYGLSSLSKNQLIYIQEGEVHDNGIESIIAPGTGLGESFVLSQNGVISVFPTEGGHVDFAPTNELEVDICEALKKNYGHVSYERILSGPGISFLESFFSDEEKKKPEDIYQLAIKGDKNALKAFDVFFSVLAKEASNLALKTLSTKGVYIAGGIIKKANALLDYAEFRANFSNKGRYAPFLKKLPIKIVLDEKINLFGAINFYKKRPKIN
jgi:glucokinase